MTSGNPFSGFTLFGGILVFVLLIAFIRNKVVTAMLGTILVLFLLINVKTILPLIFQPKIANQSLRNSGL